MEISTEMVMGAAGAIATLGTAYLTLKKIIKSNKRDKDAEQAIILQEAKEHVAQIRKELESEINQVKHDLNSLQTSIGKDMDHLRETYNGEIRNLGIKIEDLRSELRNQHGQLVALLTKMIDHSGE